MRYSPDQIDPWLECPACKDDYDGETCETCGYTAAAHKEGTDA